MKMFKRKIVAKYKGHEIHLRILRAMGRVNEQRKWVFEIIITRLQSPFHRPDVVIKTQLAIKDHRPIEQVMTTAFVDSLVLCDAKI
jgi:hypothetical protein